MGPLHDGLHPLLGGVLPHQPATRRRQRREPCAAPARSCWYVLLRVACCVRVLVRGPAGRDRKTSAGGDLLLCLLLVSRLFGGLCRHIRACLRAGDILNVLARAGIRGPGDRTAAGVLGGKFPEVSSLQRASNSLCHQLPLLLCRSQKRVSDPSQRFDPAPLLAGCPGAE
eukprot:745745-Hanusia_phi.AAC.1